MTEKCRAPWRLHFRVAARGGSWHRSRAARVGLIAVLGLTAAYWCTREKRPPTRATLGRSDAGSEYRPYARDRTPDAGASWSLLRPDAASDPRAQGARAAEGRLDKAIRSLTRAAPTGARGLDLSVAYLERGIQLGSTIDLVRALDMLETAQAATGHRSKPSAAVMFNRALVLENLGLAKLALRSWRSVLAFEADPGWRGEAEERARDLTFRLCAKTESCGNGGRDPWEVLIEHSPQVARERVERQLIPDWARAEVEQTAAASSSLATLTAVGDALGAATSDRFIADTARVLLVADAARRRTFAEAYLRFAQAMRLHDQLDFARAEPQLAAAATDLRGAGSPYALWADFYRAVCLFRQERHDVALQLLDQMEAVTEAPRGPILAANREWLRGAIRQSAGDASAADLHYRRSLLGFDATRQGPASAYMHYLLAEHYKFLGDDHKRWIELGAALAHVDEVTNERNLRAILGEFAEAAREDFPWAAQLIQSYAEVTRRAPVSPDEAAASLSRARLDQMMGRTDAAISELAQARALAKAMPEKEAQRLVAEIDVFEGRLLFAIDPDRALAALARAGAFYDKAGLSLSAVFLQRWKARAELARGDRAAAERHLLSGIKKLDLLHRAARDESQRIAYRDTARPLFELLLDLSVSQIPDWQRAFFIAEQARADCSDLGDPLESGVSATGLRARLPPGTTVLAYATVGNRILGWRLTREDFLGKVLDVDRGFLSPLIERFRAALQAGQVEKAREAGADLYLRLVAPLEADSGGRGLLIVLPDDVLYLIPWGVLTAPGQHLPLIHQRPVAIARSAGCLGPVRAVPASPRSTLVVADPAFEEDVYPGLPRLPLARAEGLSIGEAYAETRQLLDRDATPDQLRAGLADVQVLHLAAHALPHIDEPDLAHFVLAASHSATLAVSQASPTTAGLLFARDIRGWDLRNLQVVVLSACSSGVGPMSSEGPLSIARPWLGAGANAVVATLWDVVDGGSSALLIDLHHRLAAGYPVTDALRSAQLAALGARDGPTHTDWASYEVILGRFPE